jgi:RNA polymerase sigma-70 factor (ECF subfamily)
MLTMDSPEETKTLLDKAQLGERSAFDLLIERFRARIEALIGSRLGSHLRGHVTVEDILQESLLQAFGAFERFRWQGEDSFIRWLGGIAENVIRRESRRLDQTRKIRLDPRTVQEVSPSKAMRRDERFERLEKALGNLSDDHRRVIILSRIDGLPTKEIARRMKRSESAVKNLLLRALKQLQASFGDTESLRLPRRSLGEREDA